ncbi:DUF2214 domain-containing protein [Henriciella sp.]|uniref:DUF2214 domain-containing protein n=1 Tax=Henriciella sp. TaxID=1968823 RepID=UPI002619334E|nr:DUF2214 domain-containing protein [Henriciella sp.]
MNELFELISQASFAEYLRDARWGYAAVNTAHVLGISLLVGTITALDLRLIGVWKDVPLAPLTRILPQVAMAGLALAVLTGFLLFSIRPADYAANAAFRVKIILVCIGTLVALCAHGLGVLHRGSAGAQKALGAMSLGCWVSALICGRLIAFTGD